MPHALNNSRIPSLRWRLLALVSIAALLILGLAAALSYRQARHEIQELMDGQMAKTAQLMLAQTQQGAEHLSDLTTFMADQRGLRTRRNALTLEFQIGNPDGTILVRSPQVPAAAFNNPLGYSTVVQGNEPWRNLILETADGRFRIQVAQSIPKRDKEAFEIARKTVAPLLVIFPLLLLAIYFSVRRALKPLDALATEVLSRSPDNLTPLAGKAAPRETQPLVTAINRLLYRLSGSLENERRFTADAAHELRTPLAAIRIQTQVALLSENTDKRNHALSQALSGLDRATRLVEQLLRLARLDPLAQLPSPGKVDLADLVRDVIAGIMDTSPKQRIETRIDQAGMTINGDPDLLCIALRNLIDNALRYSSPDSLVSVTLQRDSGGFDLCVSDNGPGVDAEELPRLAERFYRGASVVAEGSGLGLTIVARIAELHGAHLELSNLEGGGFKSCLCWR